MPAFASIRSASYPEKVKLCMKYGRTNTAAPTDQQLPQQAISDHVCFVNGSWSEDDRAGVGMLLTYREQGVKWVARSVQARSPAQAEAIAVLHGYRLMQDWGCHTGVVFSDSKEVVDSLAHSQPIYHDWRSSNEVWEAWLIHGQQKGQFKTL
ncbi:hypothetical protein FCM35_KLT05882 [Carex littledalei]|uniref:RNase H type-1 domain-containing protein n=1 Tax=Carex littledalei TaxID=544730 RepID=A0A833R374_9POAL|nr:hypothetical protein FCM35_KLT05882 [Carex littledalei]